MKDWKIFEEVVGMIHKSLESNTKVSIRTNVDVLDNYGTPRQIDVLIEHQISMIPVKIAVECKKYKSAVEAKEIEAFHAKCERLPSIHRKIFVAANGYQKSAITSAKDFKIELYQLKNLMSGESKIAWLDNYKFTIDKRLALVPLAVANFDTGAILKMTKDESYMLEFRSFGETYNFWKFCQNFFFNLPRKQWIEQFNGVLDGKPKKNPMRIYPVEDFYLHDNEGKHINKLSSIDIFGTISGEMIEQSKSVSQSYSKLDSKEELSSVTEFKGDSQVGEKTFLHFIELDEEVKVFCTFTEGNKVKYLKEGTYINKRLIK